MPHPMQLCFNGGNPTGITGTEAVHTDAGAQVDIGLAVFVGVGAATALVEHGAKTAIGTGDEALILFNDIHLLVELLLEQSAGAFVSQQLNEQCVRNAAINNEDFAELLKFAGSFPAEYDWETYDYETDSPEVRIREGRQMLYATNISSVDGLMYIEASYNGMPVTFIGYPTGNGTGNTVVTDPGFAMSASCTDKEEAWNFLRQFFTEKYYDNYGYYGLPVVKNLLEKKLKTACTVTYEIDEYGQYKLDENGEKIPEKKYYGMNGVEYAYYCLSEEMAAKFMELVNSTNKVYSDDQSIKDIVVKQAEAFFSGQKSAEEVAKLVQSNAMIYVNEQR